MKPLKDWLLKMSGKKCSECYGVGEFPTEDPNQPQACLYCGGSGYDES